ncbi:Hypothetical protein I595_1946 [Croceitalea dokdonensis DOKDO 023]|uniref:Uncharacterized protein n=1 Tax=Croceitalea dokdonensis DOKDO 023 TaxID=1300341 RepID=A0A0P7B293_9FLAO|nr:Hypothetical protein I595_1946 [Croceitalea dokdonensis DOKDO 023]
MSAFRNKLLDSIGPTAGFWMLIPILSVVHYREFFAYP